ncbi:MAG TPA: tetratricopeptide repeat protein, partial [Trueperaceae bacterium]|nr:tetratricopeptide repeat protein [Trueperaceae bacterium]
HHPPQPTDAVTLERELLESALSIAPNDIDVLARLASVNVNLRNYQVAFDLLNRALDLRPDIEAIKDMRDTVASLVDASKETDPVKRALAEAQQAQDKGQLDQAIDIIRKGLATNPDDVRLISGLAGMLYEAKRWDELRETVARGLAIDPENRNLQTMQTLADLGDDVEARIAAVENKADIPELDRQIALHQLYLASKDPEAAKAALAAARAIDPQDRRVVIHSFDEAIRARDAAEAERIYQANKDRDIDGADGLAMRARVELAKGDKESAKRTLEAAVTRGSLNPVTMRLLADVQLDMGETFKALDNYKRAIAADPSDVDLLKAYIVVLVRLDRVSEALDTARTSLAIAQRDEQFREMWLSLEGQVGNKQLAYDRRIEIAEASPDDANNSAQLIALALDLRKFDEARQRLDAARAKKDSLLLASLDARYHADRSDMNAAMNAYTSFMASPANDLSRPDAYLAFGQFLIERGQIDRGLTTLR